MYNFGFPVILWSQVTPTSSTRHGAQLYLVDTASKIVPFGGLWGGTVHWISSEAVSGPRLPESKPELYYLLAM